MATGIVSLAADMQGWPLLARALLALNAVQYLLLWGLYAARLALPAALLWRHGGSRARRRLLHHGGGHGHLASQCIVLLGDLAWACAVGAGGAAVAAADLHHLHGLHHPADKPTLDKGISGAWLLAVVSTQALAVQRAAGRASASRCGWSSTCWRCPCGCGAACSTSG
jgi:hypothetical protein